MLLLQANYEHMLTRDGVDKLSALPLEWSAQPVPTESPEGQWVASSGWWCGKAMDGMS